MWRAVAGPLRWRTARQAKLWTDRGLLRVRSGPENNSRAGCGRPYCGLSGGVLFSRGRGVAVPLALAGLTSGFGMGPGVSLSLWPP